MTDLTVIAHKELTALRRSRFLLALFVFLAAVVIVSMVVASADFRVKLADYQRYVDALTAAGSPVTAPAPQLFPLQMLAAGIEYLEIVGSLFALVLGYTMIAREKEGLTLPLLLTRPLRRYALIGGKAVAAAIVWTAVSAALFLVITVTLLVVADAPLQGVDYARLAVAAAHTAAYLTLWTLAAMALAAFARRPGTGLIIALVFWLVVVLVIPQIGDTMDPDNQIPGGLFASLQVDKAHEQAVMAHFTGYETARDLVEQTSVTKQYERATFAYLGIKNKYNQLPLGQVWAGTFNNTLWLLAGLATATVAALAAGSKKTLLRKAQ